MKSAKRAWRAAGGCPGFERMTQNPMAVQTKLLLELLRENQDTEYGRKYGFADIHSIEEYQQRLPITECDDYAEYIDRMVNNREENLISAQKPIWYNKTSGTVGVPKKIPYTQRTREWFNRYNLIYQTGLLSQVIGMMLMRGNAIAQLKPVIVIGNDMQKRFFFTLTEDFEEIKALSAR